MEKRMKKILIVRLSAIGDVVMASPLAHAFKNTYTDSHITWLVEEAAIEVLRGNPDIDEILVWPRGKWRKLWKERRIHLLVRELFSFVRNLRKKPGYDLAVDVQGLFKSGIWTYLSGARQKVGLGSKEGSRILMNRVVDRTGPSDRISSQYLLLARDLDLETDGFPMTVPILPDDDRFAEGFIVENRLEKGFVTLCPFTTRPQKHWFDERWVQLAHRLIGQSGLSSVLLGGPGDKPAAGRILNGAQETITSMTGNTTIKQAAAIIKRSSLLIGVDTGLTHMGFALGVPTIALFGATRPYLDTDWMPGKVLYHPHECSPCRRSPTCDDDHTCMKAISIDEVLSAAESLLKNEGGAP
jgi:heptosyltransferase-1